MAKSVELKIKRPRRRLSSAIESAYSYSSERAGQYRGMSLLFAVAFFASYVLLNASQGFLIVGPSSVRMIDFGGNFGPLAANGQWWRLFSSLFLHYGLAHLLLNVAALVSVGRLVELYFGRLGLLAVFLSAGVGAGVVGIVTKPAVVLAGATGGIFGLYGALLAAYLSLKDNEQERLSVWAYLIGALFIYDSTARGLIGSQATNAGHGAGMVIGLISGLALLHLRLNHSPGRVGVAVVSIGAALFCTFKVLPQIDELGPKGLAMFVAKADARRIMSKVAEFRRVNDELRGRIAKARKGEIPEVQVLAWIHGAALPQVRKAREELQDHTASDDEVRELRTAQLDLLAAFETQMLAAVDPANARNPKAVAQAGVAVQKAFARADALVKRVSSKFER